MAQLIDTVWPLEPHTRAKHEILRRYLDAWFPILSSGGFPKVLYVDGFAGPGIYSGGEIGSPIIALQAARDQLRQITAEIDFLFIEKSEARARVLKEQVEKIRVTLPKHFRAKVENEEFEAAFSPVLASYRARKQRLPPTFAFIDPFGWTGVPFEIVAQIMRYPSCEVLVTFMYEEINRFVGIPEQEANFDKLFGCAEWRDGINLTGSGKRDRFLHDLYLKQLREEASVRYVRSFQMRNKTDRVDYYLFYGTNNLTGLSRMKDAMWRVDPLGEFSFSDATDENQIILFGDEPRFEILRQQIAACFAGRETTVKQVEEHVLAQTAFLKSHYKRQVLKPMEAEGVLEVICAPSKRPAGTFGDPSMRLRFN